jgi:hypothetical protein
VDEWEVMFGAVQRIVRSRCPVEEGLREAIQFARSRPDVFPEVEFLDRVEARLADLPVAIVIGWAREGLDALPPGTGWDLLLLDLGDCPEIFHLVSPGGRELLDETKVRVLVHSDVVIDCTALDECFEEPVEDTYTTLWGEPRLGWAYHNVEELNDPVLSWNRYASLDYHGHSGEIVWLTLGSLALLEPLRDAETCRRVLSGRERLWLLSGFEQLFFHLGTVTPQGVVFDEG